MSNPTKHTRRTGIQPTKTNPRPEVPEAVSGVLDGALSTATMVVPATASLDAQDVVTMRWMLQWGKVVVTEHVVQPAEAGKELRLPVPASSIHVSQGWLVALDYNVLRAADGKTEQSDRLVFRVRGTLSWTEDFEDVPDTTYSEGRPFWNGNYCLVSTSERLEDSIGAVPSSSPYVMGRGIRCSEYYSRTYPLRPCREITAGTAVGQGTLLARARVSDGTYQEVTSATPVQRHVSFVAPQGVLEDYMCGSTTNAASTHDNLVFGWQDTESPPAHSAPVELTFDEFAEGILHYLQDIVVPPGAAWIRIANNAPYITGKHLSITATAFNPLILRQSCRSIRIGYFTDAPGPKCTIFTTGSATGIPVVMSDMGWIDFTAGLEQGLIHSVVFELPSSSGHSWILRIDNITLTYDEPWQITPT